MNDIQRYSVIETALCIGGNLLEGEVEMVCAEDYDAKCHSAEVYFGSWKRAEEERDAAQFELAALREELAAAIKDRDEWRTRATNRLADCQEMRNALNEIEGCKDVDAALLATDTLTEIYRRAKINSIESGASE